MPVIISCRSCGRKLRVGEDQFGRKIRCPGCKDTFVADKAAGLPDDAISTVAGSPGPANAIGQHLPALRQPDLASAEDDEEYEDDDEEYEDYKRPEIKTSPIPGWKKVHLGLGLLLLSFLVAIGGSILVTFFWMILGAGLMSGGVGLSGLAVGGMLIIGFIIMLVVGLTGLDIGANILFLFVPARPKTPLRALGIATGCLGLGAMGGDFLGMIVSWAETGVNLASGGFGTGGLFSGGLLFLAFLAWIANIPVFIFFLREVALAMKRKDLASLLVKWLIWLGIYIAVVVLGYVLMCAVMFLVAGTMFSAVATPGSSTAASTATGGMTLLAFASCAFYLLLGVSGLALSIWFIVLVAQVRGAIGSNLRRRR